MAFADGGKQTQAAFAASECAIHCTIASRHQVRSCALPFSRYLTSYTYPLDKFIMLECARAHRCSLARGLRLKLMSSSS